MFIQQVSVFVENRPGRVQTIAKSLSDNGINIRALSLADTTDFGVLRIIVDDTDKACEVIRAQGIVAKVTNVIAVYVDDRTGGLASVLASIADAGIDIGLTLIGMHLKAVAVPVRLENNRIGEALVVAARTRPKFIGGARAVYDEGLL